MNEILIDSPPRLTFNIEPFSLALADEFLPLLKNHYLEVSNTPDIPVDPDWDLYDKTNAAGTSIIFTARNDGQLIGYAIFFVSKHPHHKNTIQALQDILYIDPAFRINGTGPQFIKFCDDIFRSMNVKCVYHGVTELRDYSKILVRQGYLKTETMYMKRLDQEG